jgi:hypothetical protein
MKSSTFDKNNFVEFFKYNDALDQHRGIKLVDYIPELENCRKYLIS